MIFVSLTFKKVPDKTQCENQGLEYIIWVYSSLYFGHMSCSTVFQKGRHKKDILRIIFHISLPKRVLIRDHNVFLLKKIRENCL